MFARRIAGEISLLSRIARNPTVMRNGVRCVSVLNRKSRSGTTSTFARDTASMSMPIAKATDATEFYAQLINTFVKNQPQQNHGPLDVYKSMIVNGELMKDAYQLTIIRRLQELYDTIVSYYSKQDLHSASQAHNESPLSSKEHEDESSKKGSWFSSFIHTNSSSESNGASRVSAVHKSSSHTPKGAYIWGDPGSGKSMMMDILYDSIPSTIPKKRVHFHAFMLDIHQRLHTYHKIHGPRSDPLPQIAREIGQELKVLCFDEFQVTDVADAMMLQRLFTELFNNDICIVATSNRCPDDLYKDGVQRDRFIPFIELLKVQCPVIYINSGKDYRYGGVKEMQTYYYPCNKTNTETITSLISSIIGGAPKWAPQTVDVAQGRTLSVPKADHGVCVFNFKDLCGEALGAADYMALCANYHTLVLNNIPQMRMEDIAECRRFITLVDELYENKVKLICQASTPLHELFLADANSKRDEVFAFSRTVSRLEEMQTKTYLNKLHTLQRDALEKL